MNIGMILTVLERIEEAVAAYERAARLIPPGHLKVRRLFLFFFHFILSFCRFLFLLFVCRGLQHDCVASLFLFFPLFPLFLLFPSPSTRLQQITTNSMAA